MQNSLQKSPTLLLFLCCFLFSKLSFTRTTHTLCSVADVFFSRCCIPQILITAASQKVEVWTSAENQSETDLKRLTASADEAILTLVFVNPKSHESAEVLNATC